MHRLTCSLMNLGIVVYFESIHMHIPAAGNALCVYFKHQCPTNSLFTPILENY